MSDIRIEALEEQVKGLEKENKKLNIILYHRENGLSHPDLQGEIDKSKFAELEAEKRRLEKVISIALDYLREWESWYIDMGKTQHIDFRKKIDEIMQVISK